MQGKKYVSIRRILRKAGIAWLVFHTKYALHAIIVYFQWYKLRFRSEPWLEKVLETQKRITALNPREYRQDRFEGPFWWWYIPQRIFQIASKQKMRVLDIGIGHGTLFLFCKDVVEGEMYGLTIDYHHGYLSPKAIEVLREPSKKGTAKVIFSNIELDEYPEWKGYFDIIIMTEVLEHFNGNPISTLRKVNELLKPSGHFFLSTPNAKYCGKEGTYSSWKEMPNPSKLIAPDDQGHTYIYDSKELEEIVLSTGFKILEMVNAPGYGLGRRHHVLELTKEEKGINSF